MLSRVLRYLAIALSLIIAIGFTLFALQDIDRASKASEHRIAGYEATSPTAAGERERERRHGQPREIIDDVNDVLLAPFAGVTENETSRWAQRGVPATARPARLRLRPRLPRALHDGPRRTASAPRAPAAPRSSVARR